MHLVHKLRRKFIEHVLKTIFQVRCCRHVQTISNSVRTYNGLSQCDEAKNRYDARGFPSRCNVIGRPVLRDLLNADEWPYLATHGSNLCKKHTHFLRQSQVYKRPLRAQLGIQLCTGTERVALTSKVQIGNWTTK